VGGVWFVKMGGRTSGRCVVCMENGVETKFMVTHDKVNGRWEGQNLMQHDELGDKGCSVPMRKEA